MRERTSCLRQVGSRRHICRLPRGSDQIGARLLQRSNALTSIEDQIVIDGLIVSRQLRIESSCGGGRLGSKRSTATRVILPLLRLPGAFRLTALRCRIEGARCGRRACIRLRGKGILCEFRMRQQFLRRDLTAEDAAKPVGLKREIAVVSGQCNLACLILLGSGRCLLCERLTLHGLLMAGTRTLQASAQPLAQRYAEVDRRPRWPLSQHRGTSR